MSDGRTTCKYYVACGEGNNCKDCAGYERKAKEESQMEKTRLICIDRHFDAYECERCRTGWRITSFEDFVYCPKCGSDEIEEYDDEEEAEE